MSPIPASRRLRDRAHRLLHTAFVAGQRFGLDILPRHFYSNIPDIRQLQADSSWKLPRSMIGVNGADLDEQLTFLRACCEPLAPRLGAEGEIHARACAQNGTDGYGRIESDVLFSFVASHRPRKIIQIGSGVSTAVILNAAIVADYQPEVVCIEPHPNEYLVDAARRKKIVLLARRAQQIELSVLTGLQHGDLLFVDSTHAVKPGSEVNQLILEVLPRLALGCYVHFHDIYFPYDYQASLLTTLFFSEESTLLHAFLACNRRYEIAASLSMLHHGRSQELRTLLPGYRPAVLDFGLYGPTQKGDFPSSLYLRVVA
jgi:hypothetical protein